MEWSTACPDWEERIVEGRSLIPITPLFPKEAEEGLKVFRELRMMDLPGRPPMGAICRPWIIDFVAAVFGAYCGDEDSPEVGRRLITDFMLLVAKKNAKSCTAAGIMLTALIRNWRESAEFLILAPTIEIANNSFVPARDMVKADEELSALMHVQDHYRTITNRETGATLKVVAADNETVGGKKATGVLIDELWLFGKQPSAESMLREATGGVFSRPEGFTIFLSTQSNDAPAGVFRQKLNYARGVRDGTIDDKRFLPVLYEFPKKMLDAQAHKDVRNFHITNPNLGASVDEETIERKMREAEEGGEDSLRDFLAKHANVEIGLALKSDRWLGADFWEGCARVMTLDELLARCEVAVVGGDGGGLDDLLGMAILGRDRETKRWLHWGRGWAHRIVLERRKSIASQLKDFAAAGDLVIVDRPGEDVTEFADIVCRVRDAGLLPEAAAIGVDPVGIGDIVDELAARGFSADETKGEIIGVSQGWRLSAAIKTAERKLAGGDIEHCGQPLMAWCVGNARIEPRGNAVVITKQASGTAKIDPLMAFFNAVSLIALNPQGTGKPQLFFV